jgi:hypothetical protein
MPKSPTAPSSRRIPEALDGIFRPPDYWKTLPIARRKIFCSAAHFPASIPAACPALGWASHRLVQIPDKNPARDLDWSSRNFSASLPADVYNSACRKDFEDKDLRPI